MSFLFIVLSVWFSLFLWMYLLTYFMSLGAQKDFFSRARSALLRGICIAGVLLLIDTYFSSVLVTYQWFLIPLIFFLGALPTLWRRWRSYSLIPLVIVTVLWGTLESWVLNDMMNVFFSGTLQTPLYEELGKWFQSLVYIYPAVMSPFVAIGFWFLENIAYFTHDFTLSQFIGRTLFSVPMHIFVGFFWFWCLFTIRPVWLGMTIGIISAISIHTLYNWSLGISVFFTLILMIWGYIFYGWSIENGWWKKTSQNIFWQNL